MIYNSFSKLKIEKSDLKFFFPLGALAGILMEITSFLPESVNRGVFSDIIGDHLPWATITSILLCQAVVVLFYHTINGPRLKTYLHDLVEHAAQKVKDFSSPAFSIMLGLSFACTLCSLFTLSEKYLEYSFAFGYFSVFFVIFIFASDFIKKGINSGLSDTIKELFKVAGVAILFTVVVFPFFNDNPIKVIVEFTIEEYEELKDEAKLKDVSVSAYVKEAAVHKYESIASVE